MNTMSRLQELERLPFEIVQDFRKNKVSKAIPKDIQQYIIELDAVLELKLQHRFDNITRLARLLMLRFPAMALTTAKERIYDAYNFFYVNDTINNDIWDNVYADKMEDLAALCVASGKLEEARRAFKDSYEMRTRAKSKLKPEDFKGNVYIVSIDIKPEDLGFKQGNMKEIARKETDGYYRKLIYSLNNISEADRVRLIADADITDAEIIDENEQ